MSPEFSDPRQRAEMWDAHFDDKATCPSCRVPLIVNPDKSDAGGDYRALVTCPRCNRYADLHRDDDTLKPLRRPWAAEETDAMVDDVQAGRRPRCPVDHAPIDASQDFDGQGITVQVHCWRCGEYAAREFHGEGAGR
jgi:hypothetical protein